MNLRLFGISQGSLDSIRMYPLCWVFITWPYHVLTTKNKKLKPSRSVYLDSAILFSAVRVLLICQLHESSSRVTEFVTGEGSIWYKILCELSQKTFFTVQASLHNLPLGFTR